MAERRPAGARIRDRRIERGLRQAELACLVGVSPSYLNLIEHGRRRVAGKLLADIARALDLDPALLSDLPDATRLAALRAAAAAAEGIRPAPEGEQDLLDRFPGWAALVAAQGRRIEALETRAGELAQRLLHDHDLARALHRVLSGVTAIRSAAGILTDSPDLDRDWQARFLGNIRADSEGLAEASRTLARALEGPGARPPASPPEEAEAWLEARGWHLPEMEEGCLPDELPDAALPWARRALRDAAALPLQTFAPAAREDGYDPVALARRLDAPLQRVLRRLAVLPPGHPRFGLVLADASGTATLMKPLDGFPAIRAGACPLWPLYESLAQPGRALRAHASLPGQGAPRFLCHAVAAPVEEPAWDEPPRLEITMLLAPAPPGAHDGDRLVGPICRLCPRQHCAARREPSVLG